MLEPRKLPSSYVGGNKPNIPVFPELGSGIVFTRFVGCVFIGFDIPCRGGHALSTFIASGNTMKPTLFSQYLFGFVPLLGEATAAQADGKQVIQDLAAQNWTVTNEYGNITVPGSYPSHVHLDLYKSGVISELSRSDPNAWHAADRNYRRPVRCNAFHRTRSKANYLRYHGLNDIKLRWIAAQNWTYTSSSIKNL